METPIPLEYLLRHHLQQQVQNGGLKTATCRQCQKHISDAMDVVVDYDEFELHLPLTMCLSCRSRPPIAPHIQSVLRLDRVVVVGSVLVGSLLAFIPQSAVLGQSLLLFAGLTLGWEIFFSPKSSTTPEQRETHLLQLLKGIPYYESFLSSFPPKRVLLRNMDKPFASENSTEILSAHNVVRSRHETGGHIPFEGSHSIAGQLLFKACVEIVDHCLTQFQSQHGDVQIAFANLPGRTTKLDVQTSPQNGDLEQTLRQRLSQLDGYAVPAPIFVVLLRRVGDGSATAVSFPLPFVSLLNKIPDNLNSIDGLLDAISDASAKPVEPTTEEFLRTLRCIPDSALTPYEEAELLSQVGLFDAAIDLLSNDAEDGTCQSQFLLASCYQTTGQLERSAAVSKRCLELEPNNEAIIMLHATTLLSLDRAEDAVGFLQEAINRADSAMMYSLLGLAQSKASDYKTAVSTLTLAVFKDANCGPAYRHRAAALWELGNRVRALADIEKAIELGFTDPSSFGLRAAIRLGDGSQQAIESIEAGLAENPDHPGLLAQRAECYLRQGKLELARQDIEHALATHDLADFHVLKAAVQFELDEHLAVIESCDTAEGLGFDSVRLRCLRAAANHAINNTLAALSDLEFAEELASESPDQWPELYRLRADIHLQNGDPEAALADYAQAAFDTDGSDIRTLVEKGNLLIAMERYDEARSDFEKLSELAADLPFGWHGLAVVKNAEGAIVEAGELVEKCLEVAPDFHPAIHLRSKLNVQQQNYDNAVTDLSKLLAVDPENGVLLLERATALAQADREDEAIRDLDEVVRLMPEIPAGFLFRGNLRLRQGSNESAEEDFAKASSLAPDAAEAFAIQKAVIEAATARSNHDYDKAIALATEVLEEHPDCEPAVHVRAGALWYQGEVVRAIDDYTQLLNLANEDSERGSLLNSRGQCYAEVGEFELAMQDLEESVTLARSLRRTLILAYSLNGRARANVGLERFDEAKRDFEESISLAPENAWVHYNHGLMYLEQGLGSAARFCFELSLNVSRPDLPPTRKAKARAFLENLSSEQA